MQYVASSPALAFVQSHIHICCQNVTHFGSWCPLVHVLYGQDKLRTVSQARSLSENVLLYAVVEIGGQRARGV